MTYAEAIHPSFRWEGEAVAIEALDNPGYLQTLASKAGQLEAVQFLVDWCSPDPWVRVPSSGTTGEPREIQLPKEGMWNSARNTVSYFGLLPGSTILLALPARFIGGKMLMLRAMICGARLGFVNPSSAILDSRYWDFVALTPHMALKSPDLLKRCGAVLLGGAPVPSVLRDFLLEHQIPAWESYGSTETMSHVALRRLSPTPQRAFHGLGEARFSVDERGCLVIDSPELGIAGLTTNDVVEVIDLQTFMWSGRWDFVINSGGIKLHPERLEGVLSPHFNVPLVLVPRPHRELGEEMVLVLERGNPDPIDLERLRQLTVLERYQKPRDIVYIEELPRNPGGKIDRLRLREWVNTKVKKQGRLD